MYEYTPLLSFPSETVWEGEESRLQKTGVEDKAQEYKTNMIKWCSQHRVKNR